MTTSVAHRRPGRRRHRRHRHVRRGSSFWRGFRHATHTDHLRTRIGSATGRALIRAINKKRAKRGKPPIPQRGGSWYNPVPGGFPRPPRRRPARPTRPGSPGVRTPRPAPPRSPGQPSGPKPRVAGAPVKAKIKTAVQNATMTGPAVQTKGQAAAAGAPPAFSGPAVGVGNGQAAGQPGGGVVAGIAGTVAGIVTGNGQQATSVTGSGVQGPGNRGSAAGTGVPAYGTGGAAGDGDHMISPGSAGGSATGGGPVGPNGIYDPEGRERTGTSRPSPPGSPRPDQPSTPQGSYTPTWNGGGVMTMPETEGLLESPETDAEYVAVLRGLADRIRAMAEQVQEAQASLMENVGIDSGALSAFESIAEGLMAASEGCTQAVVDFLNAYQGVIETAQSGVRIPGGEGRFFTGDVG